MKILIIGEQQNNGDLFSLVNAAKIISNDGTNNIEYLLIPSNQTAENCVEDLLSVVKNYSHVICASTTFGKNMMPRLSASLNMGMVSDVIGIISPEIFVRPIYAGNILQTVKALDSIKLLTLRTSVFQYAKDKVNINDIKQQSIQLTQSFDKTKYIRCEMTQSKRPELSSAKIIVSGGRGLQNAQNFHMLESLADKLNAAIGASRAAVDAGWVPNDFQVGQTGKIVAPELYFAIGISGAIQHAAGIKDSKIIVAINKDSEAPIFKIADFGIVGDLFEIVPELIEKL